jgi:hypothetical protein
MAENDAAPVEGDEARRMLRGHLRWHVDLWGVGDVRGWHGGWYRRWRGGAAGAGKRGSEGSDWRIARVMLEGRTVRGGSGAVLGCAWLARATAAAICHGNRRLRRSDW